jgi:hypothetical protein
MIALSLSFVNLIVKEPAARDAKFVEWSDEGECFIGRCPELRLGGVHGKDEGSAA